MPAVFGGGRGWRCPARPGARSATGPTARRDGATGVIDAGGGRAGGERLRERSMAEEWPTEYTEYTERGTSGRNRGGYPRNLRRLRRLFEERAWCNSPQSRRSRMRWHRGQIKPGGRAGRGVETLRPNRFSRRAKVSLGQRWRALARPRSRVARGRHRRCEPRYAPMQPILARVRPRRNRRYLF